MSPEKENQIAIAGALHRNLAAHLPGWTVQEDTGQDSICWRFKLADANGRSFSVSPASYPHKGKYNVFGYWPKTAPAQPGLYPGVLREPTPSINVSQTKTAEQIARDITRRFLPEYVRVYDALAAYKAEGERYDKSRAANWDTIAKSGLVGVNGHREHFASIRLKDGYGDVSMESETTVKVELRSIPVELALQVLKLVKGAA